MVEEIDQEFEQEMLQYVCEELLESETRFQRLLMESFDEINNLIRGLSLPRIENFEQKFNLAEADAKEVAKNLEHKIELTKEETVMEYLKDRVDTEEVAENLEHKIELSKEETVMEYLEDRVQLPEMKTPAEIVVATDYGYLQVPGHGFVVPALVSVLVEDLARQDEFKTSANYVSIQKNESVVHNGGDLVIRRKASSDLLKVKVRKKKKKVKFIQQELTKMAWQIIVSSTDMVEENKHHIVEIDKLMKAVLEQQNGLAHQVPSKDGIGSTLFPKVIANYWVIGFTQGQGGGKQLLRSYQMQELGGTQKRFEEMPIRYVKAKEINLVFELFKKMLKIVVKSSWLNLGITIHTSIKMTRFKCWMRVTNALIDRDAKFGSLDKSVIIALFSTVSFLLSAKTSLLSGFLGMKLTTYANGRTILEARNGVGSDSFNSYVESSSVAHVIASISIFGINHGSTLMLSPLLISSVGIIVCLFTTTVAIEWYEIKAIKEIETKMKHKLIISTFIMATVFAIVYWIGLSFLFTSNNDGVQKVVGNGQLFLCVRIGTTTNVIVGFALGCKSTVISNLALTSNIFVCFSFAAMYGILVATVLIFNTIAFGLVIEAYGSHGEIVMGIAEMAEISHCNCERIGVIDAIRTTTTSIGNGIAMESIILMFLTLLDAFISQATTLTVFIGLIVGALFNRFSVMAKTVKSMTSAALKMIEKRCIYVGVPPLYKGDKGKHSNPFPLNAFNKIQTFKDWSEMMLGQLLETPWIHIKDG